MNQTRSSRVLIIHLNEIIEALASSTKTCAVAAITLKGILNLNSAGVSFRWLRTDELSTKSHEIARRERCVQMKGERACCVLNSYSIRNARPTSGSRRTRQIFESR